MSTSKRRVNGQVYEIQSNDDYDALSIIIYSGRMKSEYTVEKETLRASRNSVVPIERNSLIKDAIDHLEQLRK